MRKGTHRRRRSSRYSWVRLITPLALALVVAAGGAALSYYQMRRSASPVSSTFQKTDMKTEALPPNLDGLLPVTSVQEVATKAGGSPVANVNLENRSGMLIYIATLSSGTKLGFSATSGTAIALQDETEAIPQKTTDSLPSDFAINTSFEEARKLAQDAFPNGTISGIQLKPDGNNVTLSVTFTDKAHVDINAADGTVIRVTTPSGATAEAAADSSSTHPSQNSTGSSPQTSAPATGPSDNDDNAAPNNHSDNSQKAPGKASVHIDGVLSLANGIYTITENNVTYTIQTDQDISGQVGKPVRAKGTLQTDNTIEAAKVEPRGH